MNFENLSTSTDIMTESQVSCFLLEHECTDDGTRPIVLVVRNLRKHFSADL